jgi:hypothetical protein
VNAAQWDASTWAWVGAWALAGFGAVVYVIRGTGGLR